MFQAPHGCTIVLFGVHSKNLWIGFPSPLLGPEQGVSADQGNQHHVAGNAQPSAGPGVSIAIQTVAEEVIEGPNVLIEVSREPGLPLTAGTKPVPVILESGSRLPVVTGLHFVKDQNQ